MELICPECMGPLQTTDGKSARCTVHQAEFQVLFSQWQPALPPRMDEAAPITFQLTPGSKCYQHQDVSAAFVCHQCGTPVCYVCVFDQSDGTQLCPQCMARAVPSAPPQDAPPPRRVPEGVHCVQHPAVAATEQCQACGAYMCATCDFNLPGNIHVCPACAAAPKTKLSSRRKRLMIGSFLLAVIATAGMALMMSGVFAQMGRTKEGEAALGYIFMLFGLLPALIGMALGFTAIDRRLANPLSLWIATIWNVVILACFLLLVIIGNVMK